MRRPSVFIATLAIVASSLVAGASSGAQALSLVGLAYPGDDGGGNFSTKPTAFEVGTKVELAANFRDEAANLVVTFYQESPADSGDYTSIGTDAANAQGNSYLPNHQVDGVEKIFAQTSAGQVTEVHTLTPSLAPPVTPDGTPVGTLTESPTTFTEGGSISIKANFASGTFPVTLYKEGPVNTWTAGPTVQSNSSGDATFSNFVVSGTQRVFARKANNDHTEVDVIAAPPSLDIDVLRDCTGNDCANTATASGALTPATQGRSVKLQWKNGSTWTQLGSTTPTDADGKVAISFSINGVSQWATRSYRLAIASDFSGPAATSLEIKFMPGPTTLGPNVLHVDVDKGVYPSSTSSEYTGDATLRQGGVVQAKDVKLEKFGVRGSSTADYAKKPYKLKFDKAPDDVFGMAKDKSWTLLANFLDQSSMRDKIGLDLGRRLSGISWTPDSRYVELFVNDQYVGAYLMTESVKIDDDRVNIDPDRSMIMETDGKSVSNSSLGFLSTKGKIAFAFKDPDTVGPNPDDVNGTKLTAIKNQTNLFESKLYSSTTSTRNTYADYIDVNSAIDFYLVKEFTKDNDADFYRSNYFWWDRNNTDPLHPWAGDNKFHFGPAWDFDRSAGNVDPDTAGHTYVTSPSGWYLRGLGTRSDSGRTNYTTHWWVQLFKTTGLAKFEDLVKARWQVKKSEFAKVYSTNPLTEGSTAFAKAAIGAGAGNDRNRWAGESKRYKAHKLSGGASGYNGEVEYLTDWYQKRYTFMNNNL